MRRRLLGATALATVLAGCGTASAPLRATFAIDAALTEPVASVTIYVLRNKRTDDIFLGCSSLMTQTIDPDDLRVVVYAQGTVDGGGGTEQLDNIPAGGERIIYVVAAGHNGTVIGNGCAEHIGIRVGETVDVNIVVYPLP